MRHAPTSNPRGHAGDVAGWLLCFVSGLIAGAALMYLADPVGGGRRRAFMRDKGHRLARQTQQGVLRSGQHARNKFRGLAAQARSALSHEPIGDDRVHERVRAAIGRAVSHPHSIKVGVREGVVTLSGPVLEHEVDELIDTVASIGGVTSVIHQLDEHLTAGSVPGLQGGRLAGFHSE